MKAIIAENIKQLRIDRGIDKKVKFVYKSDVIALLIDIIEKLEQSF